MSRKRAAEGIKQAILNDRGARQQEVDRGRNVANLALQVLTAQRFDEVIAQELAVGLKLVGILGGNEGALRQRDAAGSNSIGSFRKLSSPSIVLGEAMIGCIVRIASLERLKLRFQSIQDAVMERGHDGNFLAVFFLLLVGVLFARQFEIDRSGPEEMAAGAIELLDDRAALDLGEPVTSRIVYKLGGDRLSDQAENKRHDGFARFGLFPLPAKRKVLLGFAGILL